MGQKLFENGFRKIDAIEPSQEMLNILERKEMYRNVYKTMLGGGHTAINISDDSYDLIVISGGFAKSHLQMPIKCLTSEFPRISGTCYIYYSNAKPILAYQSLILHLI